MNKYSARDLLSRRVPLRALLARLRSVCLIACALIFVSMPRTAMAAVITEDPALFAQMERMLAEQRASYAAQTAFNTATAAQLERLLYAGYLDIGQSNALKTMGQKEIKMTADVLITAQRAIQNASISTAPLQGIGEAPPTKYALQKACLGMGSHSLIPYMAIMDAGHRSAALQVFKDHCVNNCSTGSPQYALAMRALREGLEVTKGSQIYQAELSSGSSLVSYDHEDWSSGEDSGLFKKASADYNAYQGETDGDFADHLSRGMINKVATLIPTPPTTPSGSRPVDDVRLLPVPSLPPVRSPGTTLPPPPSTSTTTSGSGTTSGSSSSGSGSSTGSNTLLATQPEAASFAKQETRSIENDPDSDLTGDLVTNPLSAYLKQRVDPRIMKKIFPSKIIDVTYFSSIKDKLNDDEKRYILAYVMIFHLRGARPAQPSGEALTKRILETTPQNARAMITKTRENINIGMIIRAVEASSAPQRSPDLIDADFPKLKVNVGQLAGWFACAKAKDDGNIIYGPSVNCREGKVSYYMHLWFQATNCLAPMGVIESLGQAGINFNGIATAGEQCMLKYYAHLAWEEQVFRIGPSNAISALLQNTGEGSQAPPNVSGLSTVSQRQRARNKGSFSDPLLKANMKTGGSIPAPVGMDFGDLSELADVIEPAR